jgi:hypothetical protein
MAARSSAQRVLECCILLRFLGVLWRVCLTQVIDYKDIPVSPAIAKASTV